jgi:hypothetical protein
MWSFSVSPGVRRAGGPAKCTGCPPRSNAVGAIPAGDVPNCGVDLIPDDTGGVIGAPGLPPAAPIDNNARVCIPADKALEWPVEYPSHLCVACADGNLCFLLDPRQLTAWKYLGQTDAFAFFVCGGQEYGWLLAQSGHADMVRYADRSAYTNEALPEPATCPSFPGLPLCGGACGSCATGTCMGRSPRHPYSLCVLNGIGQGGILLGYVVRCGPGQGYAGINAAWCSRSIPSRSPWPTRPVYASPIRSARLRPSIIRAARIADRDLRRGSESAEPPPGRRFRKKCARRFMGWASSRRI